MTGAKEQLKNVTFVLCFNRLKMLQRPKKLRMSVVSFQDQETKSSHWDSHVIQPMFSSCKCGKMPAAGFCLLDSMSLGQGTLRRETRKMGCVFQDISWIWFPLSGWASDTLLTITCMSFLPAFFFLQIFCRLCEGSLVLKRFALLLRSPYFHCFKLNHLTSQVAPTFWFCPSTLICSSTFTCLL